MALYDRDLDPVWEISAASLGATRGFGPALCDLPDLDGDGIEDTLVGAPRSERCQRVGRRVVCARRTGEAIAVASSNGARLWSIAPPSDAQSELGATVARTGRYLAVGAPGARGPDGIRTGVVHIFDVASGQPVMVQTLLGERAGDRFGESVVIAGDLDGDSTSELLVGAPFARTSAGREAGRLYATTVFGEILETFDGPAAGGHLGIDAAALLPRAQAPAGVLAGAPDAGGGAGIVAFYRWDGGLVWAHPGDDGEHLGISVAAAADLDRNGTDEIAVGAPGARGGLGRVLLLSPFGTVVTQIVLPEDLGFGFGRYITTPGDLDVDGRPDLAVGIGGAFEGSYPGTFVVFRGAGGIQPHPDR